MALKKVYIGETADGNTNVITAMIAPVANVQVVDADRGKAVKLSADSTYAICAAGDEMEGVITSVENFTANGNAVVGIRTDGNKEAIITNAGWAIRDYVVADAQAARGTLNDANQFPRPKVKTLVGGIVAASAFQWRVASIVPGNTLGAANAVVVLERV